MGHKIIVDYHGRIVGRTPNKDKKFGLLYETKGLYYLGLKFFRTEASRKKFIDKNNRITPLLDVEL